MANRVVLGTGRGTGGTNYGIWISKPGEEVLTCDDEDLLLGMEGGTFVQVLLAGEATIDSGSNTVFDVPCEATDDHIAVFWQRNDGTTMKSRNAYTDYKINVAQTFPTSTTCRTTFSTTSASEQSLTFIITTLRI